MEASFQDNISDIYSVNTSMLTAGVYFAKISGEFGTITEKIIK
jgi:hypothetical protein